MVPRQSRGKRIDHGLPFQKYTTLWKHIPRYEPRDIYRRILDNQYHAMSVDSVYAPILVNGFACCIWTLYVIDVYVRDNATIANE